MIRCVMFYVSFTSRRVAMAQVTNFYNCLTIARVKALQQGNNVTDQTGLIHQGLDQLGLYHRGTSTYQVLILPSFSRGLYDTLYKFSPCIDGRNIYTLIDAKRREQFVFRNNV